MAENPEGYDDADVEGYDDGDVEAVGVLGLGGETRSTTSSSFEGKFV